MQDVNTNQFFVCVTAEVFFYFSFANDVTQRAIIYPRTTLHTDRRRNFFKRKNIIFFYTTLLFDSSSEPKKLLYSFLFEFDFQFGIWNRREKICIFCEFNDVVFTFPLLSYFYYITISRFSASFLYTVSVINYVFI